MCSGIPYCNYTVTYSNAEREVPGPLNVECPGDWPHDPPFTNFGTAGPYHSIQDALQFAGWSPEGDGTYHWNACTSHPDYDAPNPFYYNVGWYSQDSQDEFAYASHSYRVPGSCAAQLSSGVFSTGSTWFDIYDLDGIGWFQIELWLTRLNCSPADIAVTCDEPTDNCWGDTGAMSPPGGPSYLTGKVKIALSASGGPGWP